MNIYFGGSVTGTRENNSQVKVFKEMIDVLKLKHKVLTDYVGDEDFKGDTIPAVEVFERDMVWLRNADLLVADVSQASLGLGYELGYAQSLKKPIILFYRNQEGKKLSPIISGNNYYRLYYYDDVKDIIDMLQNIETFV